MPCGPPFRSPSRAQEVRAAVLPDLPSETADRLSFAQADLASDEGWPEAMASASALIHTASPFSLSQPKDPQELIRPAVEGTRRALSAAAGAGVSRVVLTSSVAAVAHPGPPKVKDENDWIAPSTTPERPPTTTTKALAKRAGWDIAKARGLPLTTVNPSVVLGPLLDRQPGTSVGIVARLLKGRDLLVPRINVSVMDVRDVARIHMKAFSTPEMEGQRIIASAGLMPMSDMAQDLKRAFPGRRISTRVAPDWLLCALVHVIRDLRDAVANDKTRRLFGMDLIPPEEALLATARSLLEKNLA